MENQDEVFGLDREAVKAELAALDREKQRDVLIAAAKGLYESNTTPEELTRRVKLAMTDMTPLGDAWAEGSSGEKRKLEDVYMSTNDKDAALRAVVEGRKASFGDTPLKKVEYSTNRDIYNALKEVYDRSGGDWGLVGKVIKYNDIPEDLVREFIKDGKWTDYSVGDEMGSGFGAVARGLSDNLYGGLANILTGGEYAGKFRDVVPEGVVADNMAHTLWRAGIQQADDYGRSLMETDPLMEIGGQGVGMLPTLGLAGAATKGVKVSGGLTRLGRAANTFTKGAATGALASIPGSITKESVGDAMSNTLAESLMFGAGDVALSGLGAGLGAAKKWGAGKLAKIKAPSENYTKAFAKIKRIEDMSEEELKRGVERGWLKDGKLNVPQYLADEYGLGAAETMEDLWRVAKGNREVYNQLRADLEKFNYREAIGNAAKKAMIPNANLSRVNQVLKDIPKRLEEFSDGAKWYESLTGEQLAQTMKAFNEDVKKALTSIKNPNKLEKQAIDNYLKEVESSNMLQFMKKQMPSQFQAVDKTSTLLGEFGKLFNINNPISQFTASSKFLKSRTDRNFMRQVMSGHKQKETGSLKKMMDAMESEKNKKRLETAVRMGIHAGNKE